LFANILRLSAAVMLQVEVFCVLTPCSDVAGYKRFRGPRCLHLQGEVAGMGRNGRFNLKMKAA